MIGGFLGRLLLTVVAIACSAGIVWGFIDGSFTDLPFHFERQGQEYVVRADNGHPLPGGLLEGDIIDLSQMSVLDRAALLTQENYWAGTSITLRVRRQPQAVRVTTASSAQVKSSSLERFRAWGDAVATLFLLAVALLTLWRGRDATAAWLCIFAVGLLFDQALQNLSNAPVASLWIEPLRRVVIAAYVGAVYGTAVSAARVGLPLMWRRLCVVLVVLLVSFYAVVALADFSLKIFSAVVMPQWVARAGNVAVIGVFGIAVLSLLAGHANAPPESRGRMRWLLASTALILAVVLSESMISSVKHPVLFAVCNTGLLGLSLLGYLYAILRTRIVDVTVVIDRALVYSVITALVFGLFSLLEEAVHRLALGEELSWIVQAAGALGVAAAMSPLHRLLDKALERVFFHKLRMMAAALRTLGKESAFFESEEALIARVLKQLRAACASAAVYERSGAVYVLRSAEGAGWPGAVDADDPLFVSLRSGRQVLDLKGRESAAGAEGLAFPMAIGQILTGAVVTRLREGEQLDSELRAALAELAQSLGTSLYLLRYRELATLASELSAGKLDLEGARSRAAALGGAL